SRRKVLKAKPRLIETKKADFPQRLEVAQLVIAAAKSKPRTAPPAISDFDRRTAQRLGRGSVEPESRIDLHGENLESARFSLLNFIARQRYSGTRLVLVITGKGASPFARHTLHGHSHFHTPEREGKLRREVPLWFHDVEFRNHIIGFQPAHPRHGGGGAFYVKLRRKSGEWE
ncbi:MAG: Smr/MutS family protein, partial [Alphaproteobacteria bacterium]|nr:Smr/MutS family protein [Alphaproteobacteria bacterium]